MILFRWANDPEVRRNSFSTRMISFKEHSKWFASKIKSPNSRIYIGLHDGVRVGIVRFARTGRQAVVGINLDSQWRGKGFGGLLLEKGVAAVKSEYFTEEVIAYIKEFNVPSIKLFLMAGFTEVENTEISSYPNARKFTLKIKIPRMVLGTVQLGLAYGVANTIGLPSEKQAVTIIQHAIENGVASIDTARAYGTAEQRIGKALSGGLAGKVEIVTKLAPSCETPKDVEVSIHESCQCLKRNSLQTVLLHRWHMRRFRKAWSRLIAMMKAGTVQKIGVSIQNPEELESALHETVISHIQLPFNILDWRWRLPRIQKAIENRPDVVIHARSVLLQGLLISPPIAWPAIRGCMPSDILWTLDHLTATFNRKHIKDLCFAYARAQPWISGLVVGLETLAQLKENMKLFLEPVLTQEECGVVEKAFRRKTPVGLLDPFQWTH